MVKKLILLSVLCLCLSALMVVPLLNSGELATNSLFTSSAYAQESRILIEGADAVWEANTRPSDGLVSTVKEVPARILAEYADSVLTKDLQKPEQLSHQAASISPKILVEYADSILSFNLEGPTGILPALAMPSPSTSTPVPTPTQTPAPTVTPSPTPAVPPKPEQPSVEPTPVVPSPTPWWLEPQWLISIIIAGLACIVGIIRLVIVLRRGH